MTMTTAFADRDAIAARLATLADADRSVIALIMENPLQDISLIEGLHWHLDQASKAKFLNSMKLETLGEWLGNAAPARLQIRLSEVAKSSQHPSYAAFRAGLTRSGGLERAFPKV
ncbi:hypothetical protein EQW76_03740 [Rhizobium sp. rho-13.1]|nr:hypothetical protein EQW76_03740 [Rhizobium sp. rho-13.1]TQY19333.1 hypothetical protein EQW74_02685 [Rhizobium sp. rho-1.1]